jgi:protein gp37
MSIGSKIEWCTATWSPTTGCDKVSPGCDHCYAMTMAKRLKGMGQPKYQTDGDPRTSGPGFGVAIHHDALTIPFGWHKPQRVFVDSMSDLFHPRIPDGFIGSVFDVMAQTPQHTYQILTKRPKRMRSLLNRWADAGWMRRRDGGTWCGPVDGPLPNVWLGTSVETQWYADERIPDLLRTPASVRFLSCEPLLGAIDLRHHLAGWCPEHDFPGGFCVQRDHPGVQHLGWVIAGGESEAGARPMHPDWARQLRNQSTMADIPFFFKQWGAFRWIGHGAYDEATQCWVDDGIEPQRVPKKLAGRELDGRTWDEFPHIQAMAT